MTKYTSDLQACLTRLTEIGKTRRQSKGLLSTGNASLDQLLGGGLERGRVLKLYGSSGSGKSGTVGRILGHIADQHLGTCVLIDADHTAESVAAFYGPLSDLQEGVIIHEPNTASEAADVAEALTRCTDLVVVDSLGAFCNHGDDMESPGNLIRRLARAADRSGAIVIVTNQVRVDIANGGFLRSYGSSLARYYSRKVIRLDSKPLRYRGLRVGLTITGTVEKAITGPIPSTQSQWDLEYLE